MRQAAGKAAKRSMPAAYVYASLMHTPLEHYNITIYIVAVIASWRKRKFQKSLFHLSVHRTLTDRVRFLFLGSRRCIHFTRSSVVDVTNTTASSIVCWITRLHSVFTYAVYDGI